MRPWAGRGAASSEQATSKQEGKWLGAPWGAHGKGCARQAPKSRRALGLTGRAPGWGGGKLQQARLLCPRITGAKGVNGCVCLGASPLWGEGAREGWELQPPDRREGGLQLAPLMGGAEGGIFPLLDISTISLTILLLFVSVKSDIALR